MKNTISATKSQKSSPPPDFRIDFDAIAAFIGLPQLLSTLMPADLQESNVPLAEISQGPSAFELFLDRHQKKLVGLAILLAIGTAAYVVYDGIKTSQEETAGAALTKAADLKSLQAVIAEHQNTQAASSAAVLLADKQWSEGQQDAAIETLKQFIASQPNHPARSSAQASLGAKLMAQGKSDEAASTFKKLVDDPQSRFIAPYALIGLGDLAYTAGDSAKAEAHYQKVSTEFPDSHFASYATQRLAMVKAKLPIEIEAPPAPEAPKETTPGATG
jgi:TolA-binding protein